MIVSLWVKRTNRDDKSALKPDEILHYYFHPTTNGSLRFFYPKEEYFCAFELLDEAGKPARKTSLGKRVGCRFDELKLYSRDAVRVKNSYGHLAQDRGFSHAVGFKALGLDGKALSVGSLFVVEPDKNYTLRARFQIFTTGNNDPERLRFLTRLPTIEIPVRTSTSAPKN